MAYASAYLNVDSAVSGPLFRLKVTPSLVGLAAGAMAAIEDPNSGKTLFEAWNGDVQMLGSGSDYAGATRSINRSRTIPRIESLNC